MESEDARGHRHADTYRQADTDSGMDARTVARAGLVALVATKSAAARVAGGSSLLSLPLLPLLLLSFFTYPKLQRPSGSRGSTA